MKKLTKEEVLHVANLAKLNIEDIEIEKYGEQLADILTEIEKIDNVQLSDDGKVLIAPISHQNEYSDIREANMLSKEEILKNAKNTSGDYIVVPKVLND